MSNLPTKYEQKEVEKIEDDFQQQLLEIVEKDSPMRDFLRLDGQKAYSFAKGIIAAEPHSSDKDVTIRLVQYLAFSSDYKFTRKIARKMVKEKWWENHD